MKTIDEAKSTGSASIANLDEFKKLQAQRDAADWESSLEYSASTNAPKSNSAANIRKILTHNPKFEGKLAYNTFTKQVVTTGKIKTDNFSMSGDVGEDDGTLIDDIQAMIDDEYKVTFNTQLVTSGVLYAAKQHPFNPLLDRLAKAHEVWIQAGKPQKIDTIFHDTLGAVDNPANRAMSRLFFAGLVKRAHEPGVEFHYMTILYSQKQGIGKTMLLRKIAGEYYFDNLSDLRDKDTLQNIAGSWLVNDDELAAITDYRHNSMTTTKAFITRPFDLFRAPFTREPKKYKRQFALAGTTNKQSLLNDITGARRYNPITCGVEEIKTPVPSLTDNDIMLYLGEAEDRYQRHQCRLVATEEEQKAIDEAKQTFEVVDDTQEAIELLLNSLYPAKWWYRSREEQRRWVARVQDGDEDENPLPAVEELDRLYLTWVMEIVFKLDASHSGEERYKRIYAKVNAYMDANPDWEKQAKPFRFGKLTKRGYRRTKMSTSM